MEITYQPIGIIRTPFESVEGMPIQPKGAKGVLGQIELYPEYVDGLTDLNGFSHLYLIYHLHRITSYNLKVTPFLDTQEHGIFATRAPKRPNPIGISVVEFSSINGNVLEVQNIDVLDKTPLLDIKPYVPDFDKVEATSIGWFEKNLDKAGTMLSDARFKSD